MDLGKMGRTITEIIARQSGFEIVPLSTNDVDIVVILCGCPRACGNKKEVREKAKHSLLINDEVFGDPAILEAKILACVKGESKTLT